MNYFRSLTMVFFAGLFAVNTAFSLPTKVILKPKLIKKTKNFEFKVRSDSSMEGCSVALYGSERRAKLRTQKKTALGTAVGYDGVVTFLSTNVGLLKKGKRPSARVFFQAVLTCEVGETSETVLSKVARYRSRSRKGSSPSKWFANLQKNSLSLAAQLTPVFEGFTAPRAVQLSFDLGGRAYLAEQGGKVYSFLYSSASAVPNVFLDIQDKIEGENLEMGLIGFALHPNFTSNGFAFVMYNEKGTGANTISRFTLSQNGSHTLDVSSEVVLFQLNQSLSGNHFGGQILFGPDGYLYASFGDGGPQEDPNGNGQNPTNFYGTVIRIDPDRTDGDKNYSLPSDNPFLNNSDGILPEIFAYGFRNPWRFSFDRESGALWLGDVGQVTREEVNVVQAGGNYGWNSMEGKLCFPASKECDPSQFSLPIHDYPRSQGVSVTGGFVYRGAAQSLLDGWYVYCDFLTGTFWALKEEGERLYNIELLDTEFYPVTFGEDPEGELYVVDYLSGGVFKIEKGSGE